MLDKDRIIEEMRKRPGAELVDLESLYQDSVSDVMDFTHLTLEEINQLAIESTIKDLMAFRFNTLGVEGITNESNSGVSTIYEGDIPERIKRKLRSYRRLNYERK
ncbi:MAG: hypothetical protein Q4A42_03050 [Tissierellia bacterium]|nr:hypothetical protein [Tissierellia bacterium]